MLPFTPASVGVARRRLVSDLIEAGLYGSAVSDAALVLSELLSNALRHGTPLPGTRLRVAWHLDADSVRVSVSDGHGLVAAGRITRVIVERARFLEKAGSE